MKREGRQHGTVRSYNNNILPSRLTPNLNRFHPTPTKSPKSRCNGCHTQPTYKSRDKGKGNLKIKSSDVGMNHRLVSWKISDDKGVDGFNYNGVSATEVLGKLSNYYHNDFDDDFDDTQDDYDDGDVDSFDLSDGSGVGCHYSVEKVEIGDGVKEVGVVVDNDEVEMDLGFCDVGYFVIEQVDEDDEDWCLVGEL